jgi:hypothetical protein
LCGSIEVFESVLKYTSIIFNINNIKIYLNYRRTVWRNKFEMVYVAPSQVLVRPLHGDQPRGVILRSKYGHEISEVLTFFDDSTININYALRCALLV